MSQDEFCAIAKNRFSEPMSGDPMPGYDSLLQASAAYASHLALNPWLERYPFPLKRVVPLVESGIGYVQDSEGGRLPINSKFDSLWRLVSLSGGYPMNLFGEWDGDTLTPLTAWMPDRILPVSTFA